MPTIQATGGEYNVEVSGGGPPVLALHGWADSAETWRWLTHAIDAKFRVCAVHLKRLGAFNQTALDFLRRQEGR